MTKNVNGLINALRQFINEAILESDDVAAAMAALKRAGKCPVFTVDISLQDARQSAAQPVEPSHNPEELAFTASDLEFLAAVGINDRGGPHRRLK